MKFRLGVDIGGTFADLAVYEQESATTFQFKSLTTEDPTICVSQCIGKAAEHFGLTPEQFVSNVELVFCFGSTIGLNTLLTARGDVVGIITTRGFEDTYHIAEMDRQGITDVREAAEQTFRPLIPRERVVSVVERVDYTGEVVVELDEDSVREAIRHLVEEHDVQALAVSLLWAHRNPAHEQRLREIAAELYPGLFVSCGSDLSGALGEFKRLTTAVINAYIGRAVENQAQRLSAALTELGLSVPMLVMQTLGGVAPIEEVVRRPVMLLNSGPAGGTVGAAAVADALAIDNVVCMDMGGTSCDISSITEGDIELSSGFTILSHPISLSGVEIASIGAGGGSIAVREQAGDLARLRVGPESASSNPGPACYGRGGDQPTVTDANLLLGILDPEVALGGEIALDVERATAAIREHAAGPGEDVTEAAWGIFQVVTAGMADAIQTYLISKGLDPRRYTMLSFGAAGGAHAAAIGRQLGIKEVIIPNFFPIFSAFGLMMTDIRHAYSVTDDTVRIPLDGEPADETDRKAAYVGERLDQVAQLPLSLLEEEGVEQGQRDVDLVLDMRYSGQILELPQAVDGNGGSGKRDGAWLEGLIAQWREKYARVYGEGAAWSTGEIEVINYRAVGIGRIESPKPPRVPAPTGDRPPPATRRIYLGEWYDAAVHRESDVRHGESIEGPAVVEGDLCTVVVGPNDVATVDETGNLHIDCGQEAA